MHIKYVTNIFLFTILLVGCGGSDSNKSSTPGSGNGGTTGTPIDNLIGQLPPNAVTPSTDCKKTNTLFSWTYKTGSKGKIIAQSRECNDEVKDDYKLKNGINALTITGGKVIQTIFLKCEGGESLNIVSFDFDKKLKVHVEKLSTGFSKKCETKFKYEGSVRLPTTLTTPDSILKFSEVFRGHVKSDRFDLAGTTWPQECKRTASQEETKKLGNKCKQIIKIDMFLKDSDGVTHKTTDIATEL